MTTSNDPQHTGLRRTFLLTFAGILLVQAAWILVVPPFRGLDEHDHAYRADSVADGNWRPDYVPALDGRGDLISVRRSVVEAATPVCAALIYVEYDDCHPVRDLGSGRVLVSSAAARYNPAFYWVIGTAARPFDGTSALYAMRAATALLTALLVAAAVTATRGWSRSAWPGLGLLLVLTPVTTYSTAMAAPNGVELCAGLLLWATMLGMMRQVATGRAVSGGTTWLICLAIAVLATVRSLGPLWMLVIGVIMLATVPASELWRAARSQPRAVIAPLAVAVPVVALSGWWTLSTGTNSLANEADSVSGSPFPSVFTQPLIWMFQSVAAFPARDELAPKPVYAIYLALAWIVIALGWRAAARRTSWAMLVLLGLSILIPVVFSVVSFHQIGFGWQGRYSWPMAMGLPLLAVANLDGTQHISRATGSRLLLIVGALCAVGTAMGQLFVLDNQLASSPLAHDPAWIKPSTVVVVGLTAAGFLVLAWACRPGGAPSPRPEPEPLIDARPR